MAGQAAGTLEIALVADIARLQGQMREAQRAISTMTNSANDNFKKAGQAAEQYAGDITRLKASLDPAWAAQKRYNEQVQLGMRAFQGGAIDRQQFVQHMRQINAELKGTPPTMQKVTQAAGAQRAGMQQLSFQLNDIATMFSLGARPMQIFASQSGQVIQSVQMMTGGTSKLAAFLGGPWGIAITSAAVVLTPFIAKLFETAFAADEARDALDRLIKKRREEAAERTELAQSQIGLNKLTEERLALEVKIESQRRRNRASGGNEDQFLYRDLKRLNELNQQILEGEAGIRIERNKSAEDDRRNTEEMIAARAKLAGATTAADKAQAQYTISIKQAEQVYEKSSKTAADQERLLSARTAAELALNKAQDANRKSRDSSGKAEQRRLETLQRESESIEALVSGLYKTADAYGVSTAAGMRARIEAEAMEKGIRRRADVEAYTAQQQRKNVAVLVAGSAEQTAALNDQIKAQEFVNKAVREGKLDVDDASEALKNMAEQQKLMTVMQVASTNKDVQGYEAARKALERLTDAQLRDIAARKESADLAKKDQINRQIADIELETKLMAELGAARINAMRGLSGNALDDELAAINAEYQKGQIQIRANAQAAKELADGHTETAQATLDQAEAQKELIDLELKFEREARAAQMLAEQVDALAGALGGLRGIGGSLGNLIGALTSKNPQAALLGMGGLGTAAGLLLGGTDLIRGLHNSLAGGLDQLGIGSQLSGALASGLMFAGIGNMFGGPIGSIFGRGGKKGGSIGGTAGGAIGGLAFGPLGGAIGALAGTLFGGGIGALLTGTPKGRATFSGGLDFALTGGSASRREAAGGYAEAVLASLQEVAAALGADLTGFTGTISKRGQNLRYDPTGQGITKTSKGAMDFGQDEAALIRAVFEDAISDGVFTGLSEGVERLLKGEGDIDTRLQKALSFQSILDEIAAFKDPMGNALEVFDAEMQKVRDLFTEAGASAEQFADLEAYTAEQRQQLLDQFSQATEDERAIRELEIEIMRLSGDEIGALNAERELERQGLSENVVELMKHRDALLDAAEAQRIAAQAEAEAKAIADEARNLQIRIHEALGQEEEARALRLQAEFDAINPLNHALLETAQAAEAAARGLATTQQALSTMQSAAATVAGGAFSGGGGAINDPILGIGVQMVQRGFSAESAAAAIRQNVAAQAAKAFPNDIARQQGFIADFEARIGARQTFFGGGSAMTTGMGGFNAGQKPAAGNAGAAFEFFARRAGGAADAAAKEEEQRAKLTEAYERELKAFEDVAKTFRDVKDALVEYRDELLGNLRSPAQNFQRMQIELMKAGASTDPTVLAGIPALGRDFLALAERRASTPADLKRQEAFVLGIVNQAIGTSGEQVDYQERQIDALNRQVDGQIEANKKLDTVIDLLRQGNGTREGFRDEQRQYGGMIEANTHKTARDARKTTRGNVKQVELDA